MEDDGAFGTTNVYSCQFKEPVIIIMVIIYCPRGSCLSLQIHHGPVHDDDDADDGGNDDEAK